MTSLPPRTARLDGQVDDPGTPIRLAVIGYGRVGHAVLELAAMRPWLAVCAVIARTPRPLDPLPDPSAERIPAGLAVTADAAATLREARPDVVIVATRSAITDVLPELRIAAESTTRAVICTAEELAWVPPGDSAEADELHDLAARTGTAIVAAGVNPGFVLDLWPLILSGLAWDVDRIRARRISDVSVFAPRTRDRLGIDHTPDAFRAGVADGSIVGHVGFRESLRLLSERLGRPADDITVVTEPVVADHRYVLADGVVEAGRTIGALQRAEAWRDGIPWMSIELMVHGAPHDAGVPPVDEIEIDGRHTLHARIEPGCGAILGTAAQLVNGIQGALRAAPGVYAPGDLPPSVPWLSEMAPDPVGHRLVNVG